MAWHGMACKPPKQMLVYLGHELTPPCYMEYNRAKARHHRTMGYVYKKHVGTIKISVRPLDSPKKQRNGTGEKGHELSRARCLLRPEIHMKKGRYFSSQMPVQQCPRNMRPALFILWRYTRKYTKKQPENRVSGPTRVCMYRCMLVPYVNYLTAVWFTTIPFRSPTRWRKVLTCWMYAQKHTYCSSTLKAIRC